MKRGRRRSRGLIPTFRSLGTGPWLLLIVLVFVACVTQRFSVTQMHLRNAELRQNLEELRGQVERSRAEVARLSSRERIERIAQAEMGLQSPQPGGQVFLPEWRRTPGGPSAGFSVLVGVLGSAGREIGSLFGWVEKRGAGAPAGGGRN